MTSFFVDCDTTFMNNTQDGTVVLVDSPNWSSHHHNPSWAPAFPEYADSFIVLPFPSDSFYFLSRGSNQSGKIRVTQSTEPIDGVRVDIRAAYHHQSALARATVVRLRKSGNKHGVGIYTPTPGWSNPNDNLYFEVVFTFPPPPSDRSPLRIREFTTLAHHYAHEFDPLWHTLVFESMQLDTSNASIRAHSITLDKGALTSSNGPIVGHFNISDTLVLRTCNADIRATASLLNTGHSSTKLDMRTSNAAITSSISLATPSGEGGAFVITARSSNGSIKLHYDDAPPRARLVSDAHTSNAAVEVAMHPTYEGIYNVTTSNAQAVVRDTQPADPEGMGRRRVVEKRCDRGARRVEGQVYWVGTERRIDGVSTVHSSNARASLDL